MFSSGFSSAIGSWFFSYKSALPKQTTTDTKTTLLEAEYMKEFVEITINDWAKLIFTIIFSIPNMLEYNGKYYFYSTITKLGKIPNLVKFPAHWVCQHNDTNQLVLFDLVQQEDGSVNINAKTPKTTRSEDIANLIQPYEAAMKPYTKIPSINKDLLIPYNFFMDTETDNDSIGSNKESTIPSTTLPVSTNRNVAYVHTQSNTVPPKELTHLQAPNTILEKSEPQPGRATTPTNQIFQPIIHNTPKQPILATSAGTSKKRTRIVSPQTTLPNKVTKTILDTTPRTIKPLYSQIAKAGPNIPTTEPMDFTEWADTVQSKREEPSNTPFNTQEWSFDAIAASLETPEGTFKFVSYKLVTIPSQFLLPAAIRLKFVHHDTHFFTTFTQNLKTKPAHQKEYTSLFDEALKAYKTKNNIALTDRKTRSTIYSMLKTMLIGQHLSNTNFNRLTPKAVFELLRYARGFLQIKDENDKEAIKAIKEEIIKAFDERLLPLPDHPEQIPSEITDILPFPLPIKQRSHTRGVVNALRKVFSFSKLPDTYFAKLPPLPSHYNELVPCLRKYFPIQHRSALPHIGEYKKALADYYKIEDKIPEVYFDLPPKKKPLPSTYQELNHTVRGFFLSTPTTSRTLLSEVIAKLREYYTFKLLPNDYF